MKLTTAQQARIDQIKATILDRKYGSTTTTYEIKEFSVKTDFDILTLVVETGLIGDEGTAASLLCRDRRVLMIGKRGGVELLNARGDKRVKGLFESLSELTAY